MKAQTYKEYESKMIIAGMPKSEWLTEEQWNARQAKLAGQQAPVMVLCSCGHTVPQSNVMRANFGTSCPDCYDRMSN